MRGGTGDKIEEPKGVHSLDKRAVPTDRHVGLRSYRAVEKGVQPLSYRVIDLRPFTLPSRSYRHAAPTPLIEKDSEIGRAHV